MILSLNLNTKLLRNHSVNLSLGKNAKINIRNNSNFLFEWSNIQFQLSHTIIGINFNLKQNLE